MKQFAKGLGLTAVATLIFAAAPAQSEAALSVETAYLFSDWSEPANLSTAPFGFVPTDGVVLSLNGSQLATSFVNFVAGDTFTFTKAFTYESHTGTINSGEYADQTAAVQGPAVNIEVGTVDDVGVFSPGVDGPLNLDFSSSGSVVVFALPADGITAIMIGEDAGLDPLRLDFCSLADCTSPVLLFNGFDGATETSLLARSDFDAVDNSAIDQVYLIVLTSNTGTAAEATAGGYLRVTEIGKFGNGEGLEIDFIGGAIPGIIPEPASALLFGLGALGIGATRRRKARK